MSRALIIFYLILLAILVSRLYLFYSDQKTYHKGEYVEFSAQILTSPKPYSNYQTVYLSMDALNKVLVKTSLGRELNYGDYISISGNLNTLLLNDATTIFTLENPKIELNSRENNSPLAGIYFIRQKIIDNFKSNLDPTSAGLMLGVVFGIKDNLPKQFLGQIQITGVMHVIAASGMNVTMVSAFLFYIFVLFFKRQWAITLSILGILFYTVLSGFQASIIRAAIMGIIVFSAQVLGKQQYSLNTLLITGFIMLFLWPQFLLDTGFQLSFVATAGLLYIPDLFKKIKSGFTEDFITTSSAQLATLPILIINFGNYSVFSVVVNALILWTIPILMILGSIAAIFAFIFTPISTLFLYLCVPFLYFFERVVSYFANYGSSFSFSHIPWQFEAGYYLLLGSILIFKRKSKN